MAMEPITIRWLLFSTDRDHPRSQRSLLYLLEAQTWHNLAFLRAYPKTPPLYKSGVRYQEERDGEEFADVPIVWKRGWGDCDDLATWRTAELRRLGIPAKNYVRYVKRGEKWLYHVLTRWPDGRLEDPSRRLGMNGGGPRWVGRAPSVAPWKRTAYPDAEGKLVLRPAPSPRARAQMRGYHAPGTYRPAGARMGYRMSEFIYPESPDGGYLGDIDFNPSHPGWEVGYRMSEFIEPELPDGGYLGDIDFDPSHPGWEIGAAPPMPGEAQAEMHRELNAQGRADLIRILTGGITVDLPIVGKKTFKLPPDDVHRFLNSAEDFVRGAAYDAGRMGILSAVPEVERKVKAAATPIVIGGVIASVILGMIL